MVVLHNEVARMGPLNRIKIDNAATIYQVKEFYNIPYSSLKSNFRYYHSDLHVLITNPDGDLNNPSFKTVVLYTESGSRRVSFDEYSYYVGSMTAPMMVELRRLGVPIQRLGDVNTHLLYGKILTTKEVELRSRERNNARQV